MDNYININSKSTEELNIIKDNINYYILVNDFENAFSYFLLNMTKLNNNDRNDIICYYNNLLNTKYIINKILD